MFFWGGCLRTPSVDLRPLLSKSSVAVSTAILYHKYQFTATFLGPLRLMMGIVAND